jgi:hypothetical protein
MKNTFAEKNNFLFQILYFYWDKETDLDQWVEQQLSLPPEQFSHIYGKRGRGVRELLEKYSNWQE